MMHALFSWHTYFMLNLAMVMGHVLLRIALSFPVLKQRLSQSQQLQLARYCFGVPMVAFLLMPLLLHWMPSANHSSFQLAPLLSSASATLLPAHPLDIGQSVHPGSAFSFLTMRSVLLVIFCIGCCFFLIKYIRNVCALENIRKNAFCQHHINHVCILFSDTATVPFCWSLWHQHFIVIPHPFLERPHDLRLALRHELQHIRQGDTRWLHVLTLLKVFCFWNPVLRLWMRALDELQEFACDEAMVLRKPASSVEYAECLVNAASNAMRPGWVPQGSLGMQGLSQSILYRRIHMLFQYNQRGVKKASMITACILACGVSMSVAFAASGTVAAWAPLSQQKITQMIHKARIPKNFQVSAAPEVVAEINNIRSSDQARLWMRSSLQRMQQYAPTIGPALRKQGMPQDLLVIPLVESGYQPLDQSKNPVLAAGIWQMIPSTAQKFGLVVNASQDDRLDTTLSTQAALNYLNKLYAQFHNWALVFVAYEIGEKATEQLIKTTGSNDAWVLARSTAAPAGLSKSLALFDAALVIMQNPSLVIEA